MHVILWIIILSAPPAERKIWDSNLDRCLSLLQWQWPRLRLVPEKVTVVLTVTVLSGIELEGQLEISYYLLKFNQIFKKMTEK